VEKALAQAPKEFWTAPCSSSGKYHPPEDQVEGGTINAITINTLTLGTTLGYGDDIAEVWGGGTDASMLWETADADAHYLNLFLGASRNFIISEDGNTDWGHATSANPTLWIQSSDATTTTDALYFYHDQTDAWIKTAGGDLKFIVAGGDINFADESLDFVFSSHCLEHLDKWQYALKLWIAKLRLNGILFLYLPHKSMRLWNPGGPWVGSNHKWIPSYQVINQFLIGHGMEILEYNPERDMFVTCSQVSCRGNDFASLSRSPSPPKRRKVRWGPL